MGGKSSYVRAVALLVLLAQIGSFVPATAMRLTLCDAIYTRMGARDNLFAGESTFMVEVSETATILRSATPRSLVILDELRARHLDTRWCRHRPGRAGAYGAKVKCLTLFITHYQNLARVADGLGEGLVKCVHMRFTATRAEGGPRSIGREDTTGSASDEEGDVGEEITFLYEVGEGVAHRSYGLNVARLARIPHKILDIAGRKSKVGTGDYSPSLAEEPRGCWAMSCGTAAKTN